MPSESSYILVVDEMDRVRPIVEAAIERAATVENVGSFAEAKRRLVANSASLVFVKLSTSGRDSAFSFVRGLKGHPSFAGIPVLLLADEVSADLIKLADTVGARGLLAWPTPVTMLRNRIKTLLEPGGNTQVETPKLMNEEVKKAPVASPAASNSRDEKVEIAKQLLAQVLHNVKTSTLLDIVSKEDVPKLVHEITRAVCAGSPSSNKK